jgi:hypothetical protein
LRERLNHSLKTNFDSEKVVFIKSKCLSIFMALLVLLTIFPINVFANGTNPILTIESPKTSMIAGDEFSISVTLENAPEFAVFNALVVYNTETFTLNSISPGIVTQELAEFYGPEDLGDDYIMYINEDNDVNGNILSLNFTVNQIITFGDYFITLSDEESVAYGPFLDDGTATQVGESPQIISGKVVVSDSNTPVSTAEPDALTTSAGYGGKIEKSGNGYDVTADTGYKIDVIYIDGVPATAEQAVPSSGTTVQGAASCIIDTSSGFDDVKSIIATFAYTVNFQTPVSGFPLYVGRDSNSIKSGTIVRGGEELTISAGEGNVFTLLEINGEDVTADTVDGVYVYTVGTLGATRELVNGETATIKGAEIEAAIEEEAAAPETHSVIVTGGIANGTVKFSLDSGEPADSIAEVSPGDTVHITVSPAQSYKLKSGGLTVTKLSGTVDVSGSGTNYTFIMPDSDVTVSAVFEIEVVTYTIDRNISVVRNGSLRAAPSPAGAGDTVTVTVTPITGYFLKAGSLGYYVSGNPSEVTPITTLGEMPNTYTFIMPAANIVLTAVFENVEIPVSLIAMQNGTIEAAATTATGSTLRVDIKPEEGYQLVPGSFDVKLTNDAQAESAARLKNVSIFTYGGEPNRRGVSCSDAVETLYLYAEFEPINTVKHNVIFSADAPVAASVDGKLTANLFSYSGGDQITFTLEPLDGYEVTLVTAQNAALAESSGTYTLSGVSGDTSKLVVVSIETRELQRPADIVIYTPDELFAFREAVNGGNDFRDKIVRLGADINLRGKGWTGIGNTQDRFSGIFDGDGYTVTIDANGLFAYCAGASIRNLTVDGVVANKANINYAVAYIADNSNFVNCVSNVDFMVEGLGIGAVGIVRSAMYDERFTVTFEEPYVGVFSCLNTGDIYLSRDGKPAGFGTGVAADAQRIVYSGNSGDIYAGSGTGGGDGASALGYGRTFVDSSWNTGNLTSHHTEASPILAATIVSNSYSTGNVTQLNIGRGKYEANVTTVASIRAGDIVNCYAAGARTAPNQGISYIFDFDPFHTESGAIVNCYEVPVAFTAADLGAAFVDEQGGYPVLAYQVAEPAYAVTFTGGTATVGGVTGTSFTLPVGTHSYTADNGAAGSVNVVAGDKTIALSADVTFTVPNSAAVAVRNSANAEQSPKENGGKVYALPNGTYSYTITNPGSAPANGTLLVAGVDRTIAVANFSDSVAVTFTLTPDNAAIIVRDADGKIVNQIDSVEDVNGKTYALADGADYVYTVSGTGYVGRTGGFTVSASVPTISITLDEANANVAFSVTPEEASAAIVVTDGADIVTPNGDGSYTLKAGKEYGYTAAAQNYGGDAGKFTASNDLIVPVTLTQNTVTVTFDTAPIAAAFTLKDGETTVQPASGKIYQLEQGKAYTYTASAEYYHDAEGGVTADSTKTVRVTLTRKTADVTLTVTPENASVSVHEINTSSNTPVKDRTGNRHTFSLSVGAQYEYIVSASGYTDKVAVLAVTETGADISVSLTAVGSSGGTDGGQTTAAVKGGDSITKGGVYLVEKGATGTITVNTRESVTITGTGVSTASRFTDLTIKSVQPGSNLTLSNIFITNNSGKGTSSGATNYGQYIVDFTGSGNRLGFDGVSILENIDYVKAAGIHVPRGASLTIDGPGTLYLYKNSQGAGIGGDSYEASGEITFAGGQVFVKGSKTGALIGGDAGAPFAPGESDEYGGNNGAGATNGNIYFTGGEVVLIAKAQGAAIGSSHLGTCAGDVYLQGGNLTVIADFNTAVGAGGRPPAGAPEGNVHISGGSFKAVRTANSYYAIGDNPARAINGSSAPAYVDYGLIKAAITTGNGQPAHLLAFDTTKLSKAAGSFTVSADGFSYSGGLHNYKYTESASSTIANFGPDSDANLYLFLSEAKQTLTVNGEKFTVEWDAAKSEFTVTDASGTSLTPGGDISGEGETPADSTTTIEDDTATTVVDEPVKLAETPTLVVVNVETNGAAVSTITAAVTAENVQAIADNGSAIEVRSDLGSVTLPNAAVTDLAGKAKEKIDVKLTKNNADTYTLALTADDKAVQSVDGGIKLTLPAEHADSGTVAVLVREDGTENVIKKSFIKDGKVSIPLDGSATVKLVDNAKAFADVGSGSWYNDAVRFASSHELLTGTSADNFSPEASMTRGMLVTVLHRLENAPTATGEHFSDVDSNAYYAEAVVWASVNSIVNGIGTGFAPDTEITREQLATMLHRYHQFSILHSQFSIAADADLSAFPDAASVSAWAEDAVIWAVSIGLIQGRDSGLAPQGTATRAEVATILERYMENVL